MSFKQTINTENENIRFVVQRRDEDGLFVIDQERYQAGDEYTGPYWSFDQIGLFGSMDDVEAYLSTVSPKPTDVLQRPN